MHVWHTDYRMYTRNTATHSSSLNQLCEHDDGVRVLFPNHPPEVIKSGWQGTLRGDVGPTHTIALEKRDIMHMQMNIFVNPLI